MEGTARRWVPWTVGAATVALIVAIPVARAALSSSPARPAAEPGPSLPVSLPPESPLPSLTPSDLPSPSPTPTASPTSSPRPVVTTRPPPPATSGGPSPYSADWYEAKYCRSATKTTGAITLKIQVCRWAGAANDAYGVTMSYTGSRVFRSLVVDQGDGTTDTNPNLPQHSCADLGRPNPMEHGEEIHEWPKGTYTVTATAVAHRCGDAQQGADYEDTDNPETASVTLVIKDVG